MRSSNLELYRIICMLMIVAYHYVVNSGLTQPDGPMMANPLTANGLFLAIFGAWGKTGINCFLMITGYFMCTSKITLRKFLKLILQIYLFRFMIFPMLFAAGYETLSLQRVVKLMMPIWGLKTNFVECFIVFWLTIPFLTILVQNMTKRQHQLLLLLALGCYTILGTIPTFDVRFNYITWFGIIFFIASYIRLYPQQIFEKKAFWGWMTLIGVLLSMISIVGMQLFIGNRGKINIIHFFVSDSNKIFAVEVAVTSFLWFRNLNIPQSKVINAIGGSTFGVLLIHANSNAMRTWLWKDTVDVVGHYALPLVQLILFSIGVVLAIFIVCNLIDQLRVATLEKWFFRWYDNNLSAKADEIIIRITRVRNGQ